MRTLVLLVSMLAGCTAFDRVRVSDEADRPEWAATPMERYERIPVPPGYRDGLV